jgi:hypothetical protein
VRAVFEASVSRAQKGLRDLAGDADKAGAKVDATAKSLKDLSSVTAKPKIDLAIEDAQRRLTAVTKELGELRQLKSSPEVDLQCARRRAVTEHQVRVEGLAEREGADPGQGGHVTGGEADREPRQRGR